MKKTVCVIGHTESTCNYINHQLMRFLNQYILTMRWSTSQSHVPPDGFSDVDIFVVSNPNVHRSIFNQLPHNKPVLVANRVIGTENLDKLFDLEPGSRVLVVGTAEETVENTISIIHSFGFRRFDFVPFYPGVLTPLDQNITSAVTTGLPYLVPSHIKHIVDLGGKGLNLSTFAELLQYLEVPWTVLNDISHYYLETIIHNTQKIRSIGHQSEMLNKRLEVILDTVDEAIIAVDDKENVLLFNKAAERLFDIEGEQIVEQPLQQVLPSIELSERIRSGEVLSRQIIDVNEKQYFMNTNLIISEEKTVDGIVATLQPIQEIQERDIQIRRELKKRGNWARHNFEHILGNSAELKKVLALSRKFAGTELTILLEAESGVGKELFAQSIHNASPRRNGPFVAVNFAAIPESLVESELFGYEVGAFTGAKRGGKLGLFEEAHMGTIFLDEIGSASLDVQSRLLRVLEEREVRRLGSGKASPIDVRVIAATNIPLENLIEQKKFREDLFYRLCALPIVIPPLRQRREDILPLIRHFSAKYSKKNLLIETALTDFLTRYSWPGNVRELQNVVQYLCSVTDYRQPVGLDDIPPYLSSKVLAKENKQGSFTPVILIPKEFENKKTAEIAERILSTIYDNSQIQSGIGWKTLIHILSPQIILSEHQMKRWLQLFNQLGYVESGTTRQGTKITPNGKAVLFDLRKNRQ